MEIDFTILGIRIMDPFVLAYLLVFLLNILLLIIILLRFLLRPLGRRLAPRLRRLGERVGLLEALPKFHIDRTHPREKRGVVMTFGLLLVMVFFAVTGVFLSSWSYEQIERMRQLERTPQVPTSAVLPGEVNVSGKAAIHQDVLSGPRSGEDCLYYLYTIEEERENSEGNTYWATLHRSSKTTEFLLVDDVGSVLVAGQDPEIDFVVDRSFDQTQGRRRYREYRIDPGQRIFVFGFAEPGENEFRVGFEHPGSYHPTISTGTEEQRRFSQARLSGFLIVGGTAGLLVAVLLLNMLLRIHHSALFLLSSFVVVISTLGFQGFQMSASDLEAADDAAQRIVAEGEVVIAEILEGAEISWDGDMASLGAFDAPTYDALSDEDRRRLQGVRALMAQLVERTNANFEQIPERYLGTVALGLSPLPPVPVPESELELVAEIAGEHNPIRFGPIYGGIGLLIGLLGTFFGTRQGLRKVSVKRTIESVPTSPVAGAVYGLAEFKGKAAFLGKRKKTLRGPLSKRQCVHYRYLHQELREGSNDRKSWVTIKDETKTVPFLCRDKTGEILVDPERADVHVTRKRRERRGDDRFTEWLIVPDEKIYVLGPTCINLDTHDTLMVRCDEETPFLISSFTERELMQRKSNAGFWRLSLGIIASMMAGMALAGMQFSFGPALYLSTILIVCGYLALLLAILYYNDLVFVRERVRRGWANIDVALKKRHDLFQNLAEAVQAQLSHERHLLQAVAEARAGHQAGSNNERPSDEVLQQNQGSRRQLLAIIEAYPNLQSDENVSRMMRTLSEVEDEIALMRQGFNDAVESYNNKIYHFPELFIALPLRFRPASFLQATSATAVPPSVAQAPREEASRPTAVVD